MKTRRCDKCVYASRVPAGRRTLLICVNHAERRGEVARVRCNASCRNFRAPPEAPLRLAPPEPPNDEIRYIPLTKGKFAIVDAADFEWLSQYKWHACCFRGRFYAYRGRSIAMHREIMQPAPGEVVDHINHNGLNNRRCNLRACTVQQNNRNQRPRGRSRFKGVSYSKWARKWKAAIAVGGKSIFLGYFDDEVEAARAYDRKARELFGEFAYLNFPDEMESE